MWLCPCPCPCPCLCSGPCFFRFPWPCSSPYITGRVPGRVSFRGIVQVRVCGRFLVRILISLCVCDRIGGGHASIRGCVLDFVSVCPHVCDHVLIRVPGHVGLSVRVCVPFIVSVSASVFMSAVKSVCPWPCFVRDSRWRCPYPYPWPSMSESVSVFLSVGESFKTPFSKFWHFYPDLWNINRNWTAPWSSWNLEMSMIYVANDYSDKKKIGGRGSMVTPVHACSHMGTVVHLLEKFQKT